jgi:hypothetical protein
MATVHSTSKARAGRNRPSTPRLGQRKATGGQPKGATQRQKNKQGQKEPQPAVRTTTGQIRGPLREFMQSEQGFLLKIQSLLLCIAQSMDDSSHPGAGPDYPDVIELASELVGRRAFNIDELLLEGRLPAKAGNAMELGL